MELKDDEIALYAIAIPDEEMFDEWMPSAKMGQLIRKLSKFAADITPAVPGAQCLLFYSAADRNKALQMIRKAYPKTLAAPMVQMAIVKKELVKGDMA